jgi:hypothetical protein
MRHVTLCIVFALSLAPAAFAQAAPDAFDICARQEDPTARLACFDRQIAARHAAKPAVVASPTRAAAAVAVAAPKPVPAAAADSAVGLDARQLRKLHPESAASAKAAPLSIEGKVVAVIPRRPLISAFELDNGQVWEQSETVDGLWIKPQETVTIHEGTMGGFLLKSADGHQVRVKRVR